MKTCSICGDQIQTRKVLANFSGPLGKRVYVKEEYCFYCEWKGTTGIGAEMKAIIKNHNANTL